MIPTRKPTCKTHRLSVMLQSCVMVFNFIITKFFNNLIELKTFSLLISVYYFRYTPFCILLKKTNQQMHKYPKWSPNTHALYVLSFFNELNITEIFKWTKVSVIKNEKSDRTIAFFEITGWFREQNEQNSINLPL